MQIITTPAKTSASEFGAVYITVKDIPNMAIQIMLGRGDLKVTEDALMDINVYPDEDVQCADTYYFFNVFSQHPIVMAGLNRLQTCHELSDQEIALILLTFNLYWD